MTATDEKKLVLVVDDAPANLQMMRSILKDDFKIRVATSGAKALDLVKAEPHPDLILLDVMIPQMDGYEVCGILKASPEAKGIPVMPLDSSKLHRHGNQPWKTSSPLDFTGT
jgi:CheY-like chemotaxis protein